MGMPTLASWITFLITSLVIILIPGPSVVFAIGRTLALGRPAGLVTVAANAIGTSMWVIATAIGLTGLITAAPWALEVVKIAGVIYLGYLGVKTIIGSKAQHAAVVGASGATKTLGQIWREGFFVGLSNPKTAVFFMAILPQFINPEGNFALQFLLLGATFEVIGVLSDAMYVVGAAAVRTWILNESKRLTAIIAVGGVLILGVSVWLLINMLTGH
jgi:threonine/homoserine/homoserine lactone efflux protein